MVLFLPSLDDILKHLTEIRRILNGVRERIVCPRCSGKGNISCDNCNNGKQAPCLEKGGSNYNLIKKGDDYFLEFREASSYNKGIGGTAMCRITVKSPGTGELLYEYRKKVELVGSGWNTLKINDEFPLGKLEKLKDLLRREPNLGDIHVDIYYNEYEPIIKCQSCNGKGHLVCPKCNGRRIRLFCFFLLYFIFL